MAKHRHKVQIGKVVRLHQEEEPPQVDVFAEVFADMKVNETQQLRLKEYIQAIQGIRGSVENLDPSDPDNLVNAKQLYAELTGTAHLLDTLLREIFQRNIIDSDDLPRIHHFLFMQLEMYSNIALSVIQMIESGEETAEDSH